MLDKDSPHAILPEHGEQGRLLAIVVAGQLPLQQGSEAWVGRHMAQVQRRGDTLSTVLAGEADLARQVDAEAKQLAPRETPRQPLETTNPGSAGQQPDDGGDDTRISPRKGICSG